MDLADPNCRACKGHGLNFPDHTRACWTHTSPQWREYLNTLDERAKKVLPRGAWPYGPNVDVQARADLLDWAEPLGVKSSGTRCQGLHWVRTGRCGDPLCSPLPWMDHTTQWSLDGKPALTLTQPYRTAEQLREEMGDVLDDEGLRVEIEPGWYGHGTTGVFVWRADVHARLFGKA